VRVRLPRRNRNSSRSCPAAGKTPGSHAALHLARTGQRYARPLKRRLRQGARRSLPSLNRVQANRRSRQWPQQFDTLLHKKHPCVRAGVACFKHRSRLLIRTLCVTPSLDGAFAIVAFNVCKETTPQRNLSATSQSLEYRYVFRQVQLNFGTSFEESGCSTRERLQEGFATSNGETR
jgi:hypothetical protein